MSCLSSLGANQLIIITSLLSILISDNLSSDNLNILAAIVTAIGDLLALKAAQLESKESQDKTKQQILLLEEQIRRLKDSLK